MLVVALPVHDKASLSADEGLREEGRRRRHRMKYQTGGGGEKGRNRKKKERENIADANLSSAQCLSLPISDRG